MKELLLLFLIPVYLIITIFKTLFDVIEPLAESIAEIINHLVDGNRIFWENLFK